MRRPDCFYSPSRAWRRINKETRDTNMLDARVGVKVFLAVETETELDR